LYRGAAHLNFLERYRNILFRKFKSKSGIRKYNSPGAHASPKFVNVSAGWSTNFGRKWTLADAAATGILSFVDEDRLTVHRRCQNGHVLS
jgi:hypothetical protein